MKDWICKFVTGMLCGSLAVGSAVAIPPPSGNDQEENLQWYLDTQTEINTQVFIDPGNEDPFITFAASGMPVLGDNADVLLANFLTWQAATFEPKIIHDLTEEPIDGLPTFMIRSAIGTLTSYQGSRPVIMLFTQDVNSQDHTGVVATVVHIMEQPAYDNLIALHEFPKTDNLDVFIQDTGTTMSFDAFVASDLGPITGSVTPDFENKRVVVTLDTIDWHEDGSCGKNLACVKAAYRAFDIARTAAENTSIACSVGVAGIYALCEGQCIYSLLTAPPPASLGGFAVCLGICVGVFAIGMAVCVIAYEIAMDAARAQLQLALEQCAAQCQ